MCWFWIILNGIYFNQNTFSKHVQLGSLCSRLATQDFRRQSGAQGVGLRLNVPNDGLNVPNEFENLVWYFWVSNLFFWCAKIHDRWNDLERMWLLLDGMMVCFVRHEQVEFPSADDAARSPALSVIWFPSLCGTWDSSFRYSCRQSNLNAHEYQTSLIWTSIVKNIKPRL
jgi:hypothetical protein